jgi:nitroreductase
MDLYEAIAKRFSCRSFKDMPIEPDKLDRVLDAGRLAPSGNNSQPWKFVVVTEPDRRAALAQASNNQMFVGQAPAVIAVVGLDENKVMSCTVPGDPVNCAIAIDHMTLAATAEGLGTCWIGAFDQDKCRKLLGVKLPAKIIELLPIGYPAVEAGPKSRKPLAEVVCREQFSP